MASLTSLIVERNIATMRQVEEALARQVLYGGDLATNLLEVLGAPIERALTEAIAQHYGLMPGPVGELPPGPADVIKLIPGETALRHGFYPLGQQAGALSVAVSEPLASPVEDDLTFALGMALSQRAVPLARIRQALGRDYQIPLDRRHVRLLARLAGLPDPSPSTLPPPMPGAGRGAFRLPPSLSSFADEQTTRPGMGMPPLLLDAATGALERPGAQAEGSGAPGEAKAAGQAWPAAARGLLRWMQRSVQVPRSGGVLRPRRRGPMTAAGAEQALAEADTADQALAVFFDFAQQFFVYSALFVVHGDLAEGHDAYGPGADRERVSAVGVPLDLPSCLSRARQQRAPYCAPLALDGLDAGFGADLGRSPAGAVLVVPVVVGMRCVALLYADDGDASIELPQAGDVLGMASLTGGAIEQLARVRKRGRAGAREGAEAPGAALPPLPAPAPAPRPSGLRDREQKAERLVRALAAEPAAGPPPDAAAGPGALPLLALETATPSPSLSLRSSATATSWPASPPPAEPSPMMPSTSPPALAPVPRKASQTATSWPIGGPAEKPAAPEVQISEASPDDAMVLLALAESAGESAGEPQDAPPAAPAPALPPSPGGPARREERPAPASIVAYAPPQRPPRSQREMQPLPSIIVESGAEQAALLEALGASGETDTEVLGRVLQEGVRMVPLMLGKLPGALWVERAALLDGRSRPSSSGPVLRAISALRRTALPFVVVQSAQAEHDARLYATLLLGELPYPESAAALVPRLFDTEPAVRRAALSATRQLRAGSELGVAVVAAVEKILRNGTESAERRARAAITLGELGIAQHASLLIGLLVDSPPSLADGARAALVLLTCRDFGRDMAAWKAWLAEAGRKDRTEWLIDALTHPTEALRARAAQQLGSLLPLSVREFARLSESGRQTLQEQCRLTLRSRERGGAQASLDETRRP